MTIMTNFRAQDMPGAQSVAAPTPAKKPAAKKKVEEPVAVVEETVEEATAE
jgi:hypothetical protein